MRNLSVNLNAQPEAPRRRLGVVVDTQAAAGSVETRAE